MTPWTVAHQAPLSMEFSRQEYCSEEPFPSPGDFPNPGMEPSPPALQADICFNHLSHHFLIMTSYTSTLQNNPFSPLFPVVNFWPHFQVMTILMTLSSYFSGLLGFTLWKTSLPFLLRSYVHTHGGKGRNRWKYQSLFNTFTFL